MVAKQTPVSLQQEVTRRCDAAQSSNRSTKPTQGHTISNAQTLNVAVARVVFAGTATDPCAQRPLRDLARTTDHFAACEQSNPSYTTC